jgi:hypothetical protein
MPLSVLPRLGCPCPLRASDWISVPRYPTEGAGHEPKAKLHYPGLYDQVPVLKVEPDRVNKGPTRR